MKTNAKRPGLTSVQIQPQVLIMLTPLLKEGHTKAEIINEALRQYCLEKEFEMVREKLLPYAQAKGIYTDEDVKRLLEE